MAASFGALLDLLMHEYGVSWLEVEEEWTFSQALFFVERIRERYERSAATSKQAPRETVTETELSNEWMSG